MEVNTEPGVGQVNRVFLHVVQHSTTMDPWLGPDISYKDNCVEYFVEQDIRFIQLDLVLGEL